MISSKLVRSSVITSFAFLTLFACERNAQQEGGAADDTTATPGTGTADRQRSPARIQTSSRSSNRRARGLLQVVSTAGALTRLLNDDGDEHVLE